MDEEISEIYSVDPFDLSDMVSFPTITLDGLGSKYINMQDLPEDVKQKLKAMGYEESYNIHF